MSRRIALCIGQNLYDPTSGVTPLRGCVNDALLIGEMLKYAGFEVVRQVHNSAATQRGILDRLSAEVSKLRAGDCFVFWNSSHGYQVRDRSGDELVDGFDEAICTYDTDPRDPLTDDKFGQILTRVHPEAKLFFATDSCHSATMTRASLHGLAENNADSYRAPRLWLPPDDILFRSGRNEIHLSDYLGGFPAPEETSEPTRRIGRFSQTERTMRHVFLSGCLADEVSWDATFNGRAHGALTYNFATAVLAAWKNGRAITFREAHAEAEEGLKRSDYDQSPQLEGPDRLKDEPSTAPGAERHQADLARWPARFLLKLRPSRWTKLQTVR